MTLLRSLYAATLESPTVPISSPNIMEFLGAEASSASGKKVTEEGVLGLPAVWRAINVISGSCASLPLHAYKPGADSRERLTSGQAATLLDAVDTHLDTASQASGKIAWHSASTPEPLRQRCIKPKSLWSTSPSSSRSRVSQLLAGVIPGPDAHVSKRSRSSASTSPSASKSLRGLMCRMYKPFNQSARRTYSPAIDTSPL